ncbi:MAG TPA: efflux RND transporter periplasmic adaptor subunit [Candidatus Limnocylindrales bacterium]|nr:efflux RND transporter periplasmic adaptor subunit [Candidatus Limnocylindrales bacterium]
MRLTAESLVAALLLAGGIAAGAAFLRAPGEAVDTDHHEHGGHAHQIEHEDVLEGPHGGRLLEEGDFAVEITIFERGVPPELRLYCYEGQKHLPPAQCEVDMTLHRLGEPPEPFRFREVGDFLVGDHVVAEPHSFVVEVRARRRHDPGPAHSWRYESFEGRVVLDEEVARHSGLLAEAAQPRRLERTLRLPGRISARRDRVVDLGARFAGVVREMSRSIGDAVSRGETVAVVEASQTLSRYAVQSPLQGVVVDKRAATGETVEAGETLLVVGDFSSVWADFDVYAADFASVHAGDTVTVRGSAGDAGASAPVTYVSPVGDPHTQTTMARVELDNQDQRWKPGLFVTGTIALDEPPAAVAVHVSALQTWRGGESVFLKIGDVYEARPVVLGRRGEEWVEVLEGLDAGDQYARGNTFVLKAELQKAQASHDH